MRDKLGRFIKGHPKPKNAYSFLKGHKAWNKNKVGVYSKKTIKKMRESHIGKGRKGGRIIDKSGYILIFQPSHPFAECKGYVREHRLVMEKYLGRYLKPKEKVHHLNGILSDNQIKNLKLFANDSQHAKFHTKKIKELCVNNPTS